MVGKICGSFLTVLGIILIAVYISAERKWPSVSESERAKLEVDSRNLRALLVLVGYLIFFGTIAGRLLNHLPAMVVAFLWVASAGLLLRYLLPGASWHSKDNAND